MLFVKNKNRNKVEKNFLLILFNYTLIYIEKLIIYIFVKYLFDFFFFSY
jgi:hypothetical protein